MAAVAVADVRENGSSEPVHGPLRLGLGGGQLLESLLPLRQALDVGGELRLLLHDELHLPIRLVIAHKKPQIPNQPWRGCSYYLT
jgi:hypothetical protein